MCAVQNELTMFSSKTGTGAIYFIAAKTSLDVYIINARDLQIVIQPDSNNKRHIFY